MNSSGKLSFKGESMKKSIFIALLLITFFPILNASAEKHSITFDDFMRIKRISDLQISPKGDLIAFVITKMDLEKNSSDSDIWILPSDEKIPRRLTSSQKADFSPRWSPDGKEIAFISSRGGTPQIWIINPYGGEATQVSDISTGMSGLIWSPTGKHIAFVSSVFPECPDDDCNKARLEEKEKSHVQAKIFDELLYRHWDAWRDGMRNHVFVIPVGGGKAVDVTPGNYDSPPISLGGDQDFTFSPDGEEICIVRNEDPELRIGLGTNNDLYTNSIAGERLGKITSNGANDNSPHYSPDGRYIAYRAMSRPGFEADKYDLTLFDRQINEDTNLTSPLDRSVNEIHWSADGKFLFFTFEENGRDVLASISLKDKKIDRILEGHTISSIQLSPDGNTLYFLKQATHRPPEIYSYEIKEEKLNQLTDINGLLFANLQMNPLEEFWYEGAAKNKIHGFLIKPPFFDSSKKYPLVMLIHGGPQGAWKDNFHYRWNAQMFAAPEYVVALINFHGSTGYGQDFTDSICRDWGGKPFDDIMLSLDYLFSSYDFIDFRKIAAAGASYGGYMIDWIEGHTDRFECLISHSGVYDLRSMYGATEELWFPEWEFGGTPWTNKQMYEKWSPSNYVQNFKTPCLVIHGQLDFRVPVTQGFQFYTALQRMKVPSKMIYFPDEGHFILKPQNAKFWWESVWSWLAQYLK
jgi:dipeptidyl aminopeptidase/acylaminoacyl peptidase